MEFICGEWWVYSIADTPGCKHRASGSNPAIQPNYVMHTKYNILVKKQPVKTITLFTIYCII